MAAGERFFCSRTGVKDCAKSVAEESRRASESWRKRMKARVANAQVGHNDLSCRGAMRRNKELVCRTSEQRSQVALIENQVVRSWISALGALVLTDSMPPSRAVVVV